MGELSRASGRAASGRADHRRTTIVTDAFTIDLAAKRVTNADGRSTSPQTSGTRGDARAQRGQNSSTQGALLREVWGPETAPRRTICGSTWRRPAQARADPANPRFLHHRARHGYRFENPRMNVGSPPVAGRRCSSWSLSSRPYGAVPTRQPFGHGEFSRPRTFGAHGKRQCRARRSRPRSRRVRVARHPMRVRMRSRSCTPAGLEARIRLPATRALLGQTRRSGRQAFVA